MIGSDQPTGSTDLKGAILGTGGVGGYFGTRLALAGHDVQFIARGCHLDAIWAQGLTVRSPLGDMHLPHPAITDHPADIGPVDVVLLGVKLWHTETAAQTIRPLVGSGTAVIYLQNGVVKDEMMLAALGDVAVVGGASATSPRPLNCPE